MMKIGRRGSMTVDLIVRGMQGHVAYPERLDNPIHRLSAMHRGAGARADRQGQHAFPADLAAVHHRRCRQQGDQHRARRRQGALQHPLQRSLDVQDAAGPPAGAHRARQRGGRRQRHDRIQRRGLGRILLHAARARSRRWWPARCATWPASSRSCPPPAAPPTRASSARYCPVLEFGLVGETMHKVDEKSAVADLKTLARVYETVLDRYFAGLSTDAEQR